MWKEKGKIVIEVPSGHSTANSYINSAEKEYDEGNYYSALNNYLKVEEIYSTMNYHDDSQMKALNNTIGRCYRQLNEYYKAKEYFEKSLSISEKISDDELSFDNYTYLIGIECSIEKGSLETALDYGKKAEIIAIKLYGNKSSELSEVYSDFSNIYLNMEDYETSDNYLKKALNITNDLYGENSEDSAIIYKDLADLYKKQKQFDSAESYLEKAAEGMRTLSQINQYIRRRLYGTDTD
ncbi:tetratricopeptide repeat protein [Clostridium boliviensis]|uniref:Tetratricopeptide repeat protein n=1 Tax=Clostridium boliviensis TaxID=318465 RepID=A0ABU4GMN3_9CLOT|nr:tetratricopeptide repeat protein [Clostridium boliviensis]MDW2798277.1 tetratricopeptide repeat protein [Clostridium boliviensis]